MSGAGVVTGAEETGAVETGWLAGGVLLISLDRPLPQPERESSNNSINTANAANRLMSLLITQAQSPVSSPVPGEGS